MAFFSLHVHGYDPGKAMPLRFATREGGGSNVSVGAAWEPVAGAQSYALMLWDKHPVARGWVHWLVADIPSAVTEIVEGASRTERMPAGSVELTTSWGRAGYDGPQPPKGTGPHEYVVTLYALDVATLGLSSSADAPAFKKAIQGHVLALADFSGFFEG